MSDLGAIRARAEAATPGPWERGGKWNETAVYAKDGTMIAGQWDYEEGGISEVPDADFIAHAREDIPTLLALIDEQQAEIERLRREVLLEQAVRERVLTP